MNTEQRNDVQQILRLSVFLERPVSRTASDSAAARGSWLNSFGVSAGLMSECVLLDATPSVLVQPYAEVS